MNERKITLGLGITAPGALALLILFLLPWIRLSCYGTDVIELSGYEIAAGTDVTNAQPVAWLVPLAAVALIGIVVAAYFANRVTDRNLVFARLGAVVVGMLGFMLLWLQNRDEMEGIEIKYQYGAWGAVIALLACLAAAIIDLTQPVDEVWEDPAYAGADGDAWGAVPTAWDEGGGYAPAAPAATTGDEWGATQWAGDDLSMRQPTPYTEMPAPSYQPAPAIAPPPPAPAQKTFIIDRKPKAVAALIEAQNLAHSYPVGEDVTIGRAEDNDVQIMAAKISRRHAKIRRGQGVFYIYDLGSANGSFVDGVAVHTSGRLELKDGCRVRLGDVELIFSVLS